jgi:hypothetical protein
MEPFDTTLDPSVTAEAAAAANAATTVTDYTVVAAAMEAQFGSDDPVATLTATAPNTPVEALHNANHLSATNTDVGIGYCLRTVRGPEFNVAPLNPDAKSAWYHGGRIGVDRHLTSNPADVPRGAVTYWANSSHWHVASCAGSALFWTTDTLRLGRVDLVRGDIIAPWCRGTLVGWAEILNGVDVWPRDNKPPFVPWTKTRRLEFLRAEARRERAEGHTTRARQFTHWADRLQASIDGQ